MLRAADALHYALISTDAVPLAQQLTGVEPCAVLAVVDDTISRA
jgi:hypothetical protein